MLFEAHFTKLADSQFLTAFRGAGDLKVENYVPGFAVFFVRASNGCWKERNHPQPKGKRPAAWSVVIAPTEVRCEFLKSSFFVVAVFLWSNRVIIRINMHWEATRNPYMVPWGSGEGRKKYFFLSLIFYEQNISI